MPCHYNNSLACLQNQPPALQNPLGGIRQNIVNLATCTTQQVGCPAYQHIFHAGVCWDAVRACIYIGSANAAIHVPDNVLLQAHPNDVQIVNQNQLINIQPGNIVKFFRNQQHVPNGTQAGHVMIYTNNGHAAGSNNGAIGNMQGHWSMHNIGLFQWNAGRMIVPDNGHNLLYTIRVSTY